MGTATNTVKIYPDAEKEPKVVSATQFSPSDVRNFLRDSELQPLTYEFLRTSVERLYYHTFNQVCSDTPAPASFHVMQDLKDAALQMLHEAGVNIFFSRVSLENFFLFWRHMILFEQRLTLWEMPKRSDELLFLKRYSPFFLYRDLWAALLAPYWEADTAYADHFRRTAATYFAQLLPTRPCRAIARENSQCPKGAGFFCGEVNFPQADCSKRLDPVLVAAFADCVCCKGYKSGQLTVAAKDLLNAVLEAVEGTQAALFGQLWVFLTDYMLTKYKGSVALADLPWYESARNQAHRLKEENTKDTNRLRLGYEEKMIEAYLAACAAAGTFDYTEHIVSSYNCMRDRFRCILGGHLGLWDNRTIELLESLRL